MRAMPSRSVPLALLLLASACDKSNNAGQPPGGPACSTEAKMCPDGTAVGRTGPNCEFAACPDGQPPPDAQGTPCTREAKVCPDGSAVGRSGPNCEFAPCPDADAQPPPSDPGATVCTMDAKLCPDGSSVGRSGPNCEFAPCPAKK